MKLAVCQLPNNLSPAHAAWVDFVARIDRDRPDLTLLNEMPFGPWISGKAAFDSEVAAASVAAHESALPALRRLPTAVLTSRPIPGREKLYNEAFLLADGAYTSIHHKQYFPNEEGFFEEAWFAPERRGFDVVECRDLRIGVLLCTELMFTEWARHYRRQNAHVIVSPRASGNSSHWMAAARMAAIVSGCYVLSSNRSSPDANAFPLFGGQGFAFSPNGELLNATSDAAPFFTVDIDKALVADAQNKYPCTVKEIEEGSF